MAEIWGGPQLTEPLVLLLLPAVTSQVLYNVTIQDNGICGTVHCRDLQCLREVERCVVILGNFTFIYFGPTKPDMFENITFWNLKEITGYMAIYEVPVIESIGQLFPSLVRIRGVDLLHNYALIIYDMYQLTEINLYSLLKIDRGGVIIWGGPSTCYIDTINWRTIAPRYRHVLRPAHSSAPCKRICTCCSDPEYNTCWNLRNCQRYTEGPEARTCHEECLGCRYTKRTDCDLCRNYTYRKKCVPKCPENTVVLPENQYCLTEEECLKLGRWVWNQTCVRSCPDDYQVKKNKKTGITTCFHCPTCKEYCGNVTIISLGTIQAAHRCVYVKGSLTIHIRGVPEAIEEMHLHLGRIQEVYDYVAIHDSHYLARIDFLPSLKRIRGRILKDNKYSLVIRDNPNLQTVFLPNVTKNLRIDNGTIEIHGNPALCTGELDKLTKLFPHLNTTLDYGGGLNAYSGCYEVTLGIKVVEVNLTSAIVSFVPEHNTSLYYTILYARVSPGKPTTVIPEICSNYEWHSKDIPKDANQVQLTNLRPSSTYLVCIETYDLEERYLKRSTVHNFSTTVGKPEPPFIVELVADTPYVVVLRWVDHVDYVPHITRYELNVMLIEIDDQDISTSNQCRNLEEKGEFENSDEISRHAVVMRPPPDYGKGCESMCGILSTAPHGAMVEEYFDICNSMGSACNDVDEEPSVRNSSFGYFIRTLFLNITGPRNSFQIGDLAPFRDYRFRLRACTDDMCSRSARSVVRTLPSLAADVPVISGIKVIKSEFLSVSWAPPVVSNGPVLAYLVKLMPVIKGGTLQTQTWCVPANQTTIEVKSEKGKNYTVQLCSLSLASKSGCTEVRKVLGTEPIPYVTDLRWPGVFFAVILCTTSVLVGYLWKSRVKSDSLPLVDITSSYRTDTEPPIFSLLDFSPSLHAWHTEADDL